MFATHRTSWRRNIPVRYEGRRADAFNESKPGID